MTRSEALRLAQYALHGGVTMELPSDSGRIRKIADSILDAHKRGSENERSVSFVNENGRSIDAEVSDTNEPGDVRIVIRGPHSESENIVTRMEAVVLHRLLGAHLAAQQPEAQPAPEQPDAELSLTELKALAFDQLTLLPNLCIQCPSIGLVFTSHYGQTAVDLLKSLLSEDKAPLIEAAMRAESLNKKEGQ